MERGACDSLADDGAGLGVADEHASDAGGGRAARVALRVLVHARMHLEQRLLQTRPSTVSVSIAREGAPNPRQGGCLVPRVAQTWGWVLDTSHQGCGLCLTCMPAGARKAPRCNAASWIARQDTLPTEGCMRAIEHHTRRGLCGMGCARMPRPKPTHTQWVAQVHCLI